MLVSTKNLVLLNFLIAKFFDLKTVKTALRKTIRSAVLVRTEKCFKFFRSYSNYDRQKLSMRKFSDFRVSMIRFQIYSIGGIGGIAFANKPFSSSTESARTHAVIPAFQTKLLAVNCPVVTICVSVAISKGPVA